MNVEHRTVDVSHQAALVEATALADFYRTRCLIQAQKIMDLTELVAVQHAEIEALKPPAETPAPVETEEQ